jgi:hypothetical protein
MNPIRAIRQKCIECCGGSHKEVRLCSATTCPLHAMRLGKNPGRHPSKRTEKQLEALREANSLRKVQKGLQRSLTAHVAGLNER